MLAQLRELQNRVGDIVHLGIASAYLVGDVHDYIAAPALGAVESDVAWPENRSRIRGSR
jgi:hypothetical protein